MQVLASADVFVQPSIFEGHSLALMEAARLGVPLVVSDVAAQIEAITCSDGTRCGIAVGLHDDRALSHALQELIDDPAHHLRWASAAARLADEASFVRMLSSYQSLMAP
jgi:glycosyltransferase involved in cell wall biosynthesis